MENNAIPAELVKRLQSVKNKRARVVIDHIIAHGFITTEDLQKYGYNHPPRAARDVREAGIPLETFFVESSDGQRIAAYRLGDPRQIRHGNLKGRGVFSKKLKKQLYQLQNGRCAICGGQFALHELQVDHRIPYLVTDGNGELKENSADYMLLCAVHNRSKSWSCEHCQNGKQDKDVSVCAICYWASPENYSHVAMQQERRVEITWQGNQVREYEKLKRDAKKQKSNVPDYIKSLLRGMFGKK